MDQADLLVRAELTDLITAYTRAVDTRRWNDLDQVFAPDAVLDYSSVGGPVGTLDTVVPWLEQGLRGFDRYQHVIGQISFALAGDTAAATAYFTNPLVARAADGTDSVLATGGCYYHHEFARTTHGWRSMRLVDEVVWLRGG